MKTAIMGFGNPVRSDDAIGIYVIEELKKIIGDNDIISILDMVTAAFAPLPSPAHCLYTIVCAFTVAISL